MFDWIAWLIERGGYAGIALLMFLENLFPPIPSELIMPAAGYKAASGGLNVALVIASGAFGSLCGNLFWYGVGRWIGGERLKRWAGHHGRWLTVAPAGVDRVNRWFERQGGKTVFLGQLVPTLRTLISVPAGMFRMPLARFLLVAGAGTILWTGGLALAGFFLGTRFGQVSVYMNPAANLILGGILLLYLYRVVRWRGRRED